eukprot:6168383-Pyramimonas_sp.AAC.1
MSCGGSAGLSLVGAWHPLWPNPSPRWGPMWPGPSPRWGWLRPGSSPDCGTAAPAGPAAGAGLPSPAS